MNSQSLWGDYDTVSSLSISELVPQECPLCGSSPLLLEWRGTALITLRQGVGGIRCWLTVGEA